MPSTPFSSISALRDSIISPNAPDAVWTEKMLHQIPDLPIVKDRAAYLVDKAKGKVVLDIGCTGPISKAIKGAAKKYYGIDQVAADEVVAVDVDHRPEQMPKYEDVEVIICSEILEHLANPGYFLLALKEHYAGKELYITVPNAGAYAVRDGCEMVNKDHVAWYSYTTLKTLLTRYGYEIKLTRWYNSPGNDHYKSEGLIVMVN